jgi:hypothetical protein
MPLTRWTIVAIVLSCLMLALVGAFALVTTFDIWQSGIYQLTAHRVVPRLITQAAQPMEFALRCLFLAALGSAMFSAGLLGLSLLAARFAALGRRFQEGPFQAEGWFRALLLPALLLVLALALLLINAAFFD